MKSPKESFNEEEEQLRKKKSFFSNIGVVFIPSILYHLSIMYVLHEEWVPLYLLPQSVPVPPSPTRRTS